MSTEKYEKKLFITHALRWQDATINVDGSSKLQVTASAIKDIPSAVYREAGLNYPKFFKMDILSRVAFVAGELLDIPAAATADKTRIATVISTASGSIDVDKKFEESRQDIASPALFVYTLPNIMLGELCIRHGFKGAQMCLISAVPNAMQTFFHVHDLMIRGAAEACLCGHVDADDERINASLMWVSDKPGLAPFTEAAVEKIYQHP